MTLSPQAHTASNPLSTESATLREQFGQSTKKPPCISPVSMAASIALASEASRDFQFISFSFVRLGDISDRRGIRREHQLPPAKEAA